MMGFRMAILMILFWIVVVGLAVWLLGRLFPRGQGHPQDPAQGRSAASETALDIAKRRYARGEISKAEYEEIRRTLEA